MTLGMAARSSVTKANGARNMRGHISVRKTATPMASGTASSSARKDDTSVPNTNGNALKCPFTGSQYMGDLVSGSTNTEKKKWKPNLLQDSCEPRTSSSAISTTMPKMLSAQST